MRIKTLKSAGCGIDEKGYVYAQLTDGNFDLKNEVHISDISREWLTALSKEDKKTIETITKMKLEKNKLTPRQARILQDAFEIILDFNNKEGDAYGNMRCELWTKESPFNKMFRISNSYDERGMLFDFKDIDNAEVQEIYSQKEIQKRNS